MQSNPFKFWKNYGECNRMSTNAFECRRVQANVANAVVANAIECEKLKSTAVNYSRMQSITNLRQHRIRLVVALSSFMDIFQ